MASSSTSSDQAAAEKAAKWQARKAKANEWFLKIGAPVNKLSNKLGAEAFWPTTLDKENDKAARILRSFCLDGFYSEQGGSHGTEKKQKTLDHIPAEVIRGCKGLAIFTVMRMGLHWSGAGGSGVVLSRLPNGEWSAPSGILIHTLGWGLMAGADIYDCVAVINNDEGMKGFTMLRCTLGAEVSASVGPLGGGKQLDSEVLKRRAPVWTYIKSKGLYGGVQVDGTIIVERTGENERFYARQGLRSTQILQGEVQPPTGTAVQLWETIQAAEGLQYNPAVLPPPYEKSPGDHEVHPPQDGSHAEYNAFADPTEHVNAKR